VVSNDSAASHIAAALRVPSVCVVGGGIVGRYHPYPPDQAFNTTAPVPVGLTSPMPCFDCGWRCRFRLAPGQSAPCVEAVEPERVLAAALGLLQRSGAP
jgi:ADP-heptose:LPS heptosyltransferase